MATKPAAKTTVAKTPAPAPAQVEETPTENTAETQVTKISKEVKAANKHLLGRIKYMIYMDGAYLESAAKGSKMPVPGWALDNGVISVSKEADDSKCTVTHNGEEFEVPTLEVLDFVSERL